MKLCSRLNRWSAICPRTTIPTPRTVYLAGCLTITTSHPSFIQSTLMKSWANHKRKERSHSQRMPRSPASKDARAMRSLDASSTNYRKHTWSMMCRISRSSPCTSSGQDKNEVSQKKRRCYNDYLFFINTVLFGLFLKKANQKLFHFSSNYLVFFSFK